LKGLQKLQATSLIRFKMPPIFHLITTIEMGGAEKQLLILAKEQSKRGLTVVVIPLKGEPELLSDFEKVGVTVDLSLINKPFLSQVFLFIKKFNEKRLILHAHLPRAELIASLTSMRNPFFVSRHNAEKFYPNANKTLSRYLSRFVILRARRIIAISFAVLDFNLSSGEAQSTRKFEVIHYGIENNSSPSGREKISITMGTTPNPEFKIGTIARIEKQKDFPTLLTTLKMISEKFPDARLSVVGDGLLLKEMQQLSRDLEVDHLVTWRGRISEIDEYLKSLDLFILTSVYEGFGLVLLEAMKNSVPVIASRNSAIPEVMGEKYDLLAETGSPVDFYKKVEKFRLNNMRENVISYQDDRLKQFSVEKMEIAIYGVYQDS
jgi:glycosyltransferase involved in cell wall biosynthesis